MKTDKIIKAEKFARGRHEGQFRKGLAAEPYTVHLEEVVAFVEAEGGSEDAICAAWLHDTVEDCPPTSFADIEHRFGPEVASIVRELTDDKNLLKAERKQLQVINAAKKSHTACLVKIADKTSNLNSLAKSPPADWSYERRSEYVIWAATVVNALAQTDAAPWLRFHTGCQIVTDANEAHFIWVALGNALPALNSLRLGSDAYPDQSATCVIETLALHANVAGWTLQGPGIQDKRHLQVTGLTPDFTDQWRHNHASFPRGVDVFLTTPTHVVGLPRTTRILNTQET